MVQNGQADRIAPTVAQVGNLFNKVSELDHSIGKGAQSTIDSMNGALSGTDKATKALNISTALVNPLLIGAAAARVITSDDKDKALVTNGLGLGSMFAVEKVMKNNKDAIDKGVTTALSSSAEWLAKNFDCFDGLTKSGNKYVKVGSTILKGVLYAGASILASTGGYKAGEVAVDAIRGEDFDLEKSKSEAAVLKETLDSQVTEGRNISIKS